MNMVSSNLWAKIERFVKNLTICLYNNEACNNVDMQACMKNRGGKEVFLSLELTTHDR